MKKLVQLLKTLSRSDAETASQSSQTSERPAPQKIANADLTFAELGLIEPLMRAIREQGYESPTPIQEAAIPHVLHGRDLLGCAQTGTGKTAAFALPILQRLALSEGRGKGVCALILTPTRELAVQIDESFKDYGRHLPLKRALIFGGVGDAAQKRALQSSPDILVATPGRLLDLLGQGYVDFSTLKIFVLDEADRMLDMGFIHDVKKIIKALPRERQNLLFSATMPPEIQQLTQSILRNAARVEVTPAASTSERIDQSVYFVDKSNKRHLLLHVLRQGSVKRALVFTRTKAVANRVAKFLSDAGIQAEAIHGNKSQNARQRALNNFKAGATPILVASDLASRGIDIDEVTHVINYDLPNVSETYVHRIGRTGRAAREGIAISFCDREERPYLADIERLIRKKVPVVSDHPFPPGSAPQEPGGPKTRESPAGGLRGHRPKRTRNDTDRRPTQASHPRRSDQQRPNEGLRNAGSAGPAKPVGQGEGARSGGKRRSRRRRRGAGPKA